MFFRLNDLNLIQQNKGMTRQERFLVYTLASINFTNILDSMIMMPLGDVFMNLFGISPSEFSILVSSYAIGAFISSVVGTIYLDRFDRKKALSFIYAGFIIGTFLCGLSNSYFLLLGVRFITGLFGGMIGALVLSIVSDTFAFVRRGKAMGVIMAGFSAAAALGVPLALLLAEQISWRMPFFFIAGIAIVVWILLFVSFPSMTSHLSNVQRQNLWRTLQRIWSDSNQAKALILSMVLVLGHYMIIPFIAPYMTRNVGFTQAQITWIYFIGGGLTVFSAPLIGRLTDQYGAKNVFITLMLLSFIPVVFITHMNPVAIPVALIATSAFFVLGSGRMIAPQTMITASVGPETRGSFMSLRSAMVQLSIALSAFVSGQVVQENADQTLSGYNWVGYLSIIICIGALYIGKDLKVAKGN